MNATNGQDTTKFNLFTAFAQRSRITLRGIKFLNLNSIQHEDGSTHRFNVTGNIDLSAMDTKTIDISKLDANNPLRSGVATIFVETID